MFRHGLLASSWPKALASAHGLSGGRRGLCRAPPRYTLVTEGIGLGHILLHYYYFPGTPITFVVIVSLQRAGTRKPPVLFRDDEKAA